jgi:hypothetical protein
MPQHSPFSIALTQDEEQEPRHRAAKYTLPYSQVLRAKMGLLAAEDLPNDVIAARFDTRGEVVSQWRKHFFYERLRGLEELRRPGRRRAERAGAREPHKGLAWRPVRAVAGGPGFAFEF